MRTIASDRLLLRPWRDEDADFLLDLESRWEVVRFLGAQPTVMDNREDALASIARRRAVDDPIHGIWAITTAADGRPVGTSYSSRFACRPGNRLAGRPTSRSAGTCTRTRGGGHGYATEAAAVLDDAFSRGLTRVVAVTKPDNRASQAVCRRLGMTHLGRTTRYGIALVQRQWFGRRPEHGAWFEKSPLNEEIDVWGVDTSRRANQINLRKLQFCGQFSFRVSKPGGPPRTRPARAEAAVSPAAPTPVARAASRPAPQARSVRLPFLRGRLRRGLRRLVRVIRPS